MITEKRQYEKQNGSALILVVVVTVLLAVIGVMFLMVSRASEMETAAVIESKDLDNAVNSVVSRINEVLVEDLFDASGFVSNPHDAITDDPWLCDLEPNLVDTASTPTPNDPSNDECNWLHITDLWNQLDPTLNLDKLFLDDGAGTLNWQSQEPSRASYPQADADGDGVADSRWVQVPNLTTSRGEPVFAAVRIIDNCAMLNLNTACNFYPDAAGPWESADWEYVSGTQYNSTGRYLSELNYNFFLRGEDRLFANNKRIEDAKDSTPLLFTPQAFHDELIMNIENPPSSLIPFDISDELEIRNRYLLTSLNISRFENEAVTYETFDYERGFFAGGWNTPLRVKRVPIENDTDFEMWKRRLGHLSSDDMSGDVDPVDGDYYDRRHLCTFYSFDRPLPKGEYLVLGPVADETVRSVFMPKGTATTNIESPLYTSAPYNNIETRQKILHLLYALREYYYDPVTDNVLEAAKKSAQIVANIIDFSDGNFDASGSSVPLGPVGDHPRDYGPFDGASFDITDNNNNTYTIDYKQQINTDCTFLTQGIIDAMILEISYDVLKGDVVNPAVYDFGLDSEIVFGYERQPFISEIYAERDTTTGTPLEFAVELVNPYQDSIDLTGLKLRIGSSYKTADGEFTGKTIPKTDLIKGPGRFVIYNKTGLYTDNAYTHYHQVAGMPLTFVTGDCEIILTRNAPANSGETEIIVDAVQGEDYNKDATDTIFKDGQWSSVRKDSSWSFINPNYSIKSTSSIGSANDPNSTAKAFQLAVSNDGEAVSRWGDIEVLSLYGNPSFDIDPNNPITVQIEADPNGAYFDLLDQPKVLGYISPMNRPDKGSLPGRININTAPLHVMAAALPPSLIRLKNDPNTAVTVAQMIIDKRPYDNIGQLLDLDFFVRLAADDDTIAFTNGVGDDQNIKDDIEERDWFMTNLANKFTVRSDVFTAYILVRLGEDGPQRRMIGIFDRSQVWNKNDRPKRVALHPVPDPR